ncbi:type II toxin-antitoxin system RelE/ParE family toxin [Roseisolibacter sp. H3M3-2]|uniref:type II toxin-antitoxin system RelE/ParE family toxin n=1 Tax=Roseisolibacter sp. H3M3-2 TaxID=3031323 RepID=UPI0023DAAB27|nr:type II toxin-antitoxin system RelE/ParE family toxin [Roseisolibacter sp. H3M3-2]MDF1501803.1 type II toxin-antitoxin system RelE/ParE family toxin [Roseisolibacter sp. H3M3-2]
MSHTRIVWSAQAVDDVAEIHDYIARNSPRYAAVVSGRLVAAVDRLRLDPESGRMVPELADPTVREVIHGAYRLVYELRAGVVEVLTVFRGSRQFPSLDR